MSIVLLTTVAALERRLGVPEGSLMGGDLDRATAALEDASSLIRAEAKTDWTYNGLVRVPEQIQLLCARVALRAYRNPTGLVQEALGDYSYRLADQNVGLELTDAERKLIRSAPGAKPHTAYTVRTPSVLDDGTGFDPLYKAPGYRNNGGNDVA